MIDPQKYLTEYLEKLIFRFLYIDSLNRQLIQIGKWIKPDRIQALDIGAHFFELSQYSISRTILIELCKLVSHKEEKSLIDWLNQAKEHYGSLDVSIYDPEYTTGRERRQLSRKEFEAIIDKDFLEIESQSDTINKLRIRRDKVIAHADAAFFNEPSRMQTEFPLSDLDVTALMMTLSEILRMHHVYLLHSDMRMEVSALTDVETVLKYVRGFVRVRKDAKRLWKHGIRVGDYLLDDADEKIF